MMNGVSHTSVGAMHAPTSQNTLEQPTSISPIFLGTSRTGKRKRGFHAYLRPIIPRTRPGNEPGYTPGGIEATGELHGDSLTDTGVAVDDLEPSAAGPAPMRAHLTINLDEEPIDVLYNRKLSLEDAAQRPCIVPGNALHLIDDDPSPRSQTPSSVIIVADVPRSSHDQAPAEREGDRNMSQPPPPPRPAPRVRFRSRVRITSGVHKHRHSASAGGARNANASGTPCSSASDSPSSSISAPLRYQADENATWGPLGKRLSAYAGAGGWQKRGAVSPQHKQERVRRPHGAARASSVAGSDERTPLVHNARRTAYVDPQDDLREGDEDDGEDRAMRAAALRREHDAVFGKWPWRLFNRHVSAAVSSYTDADARVCSGGGGRSSLCCVVAALTTLTTTIDDDTYCFAYIPTHSVSACHTHGRIILYDLSI